MNMIRRIRTALTRAAGKLRSMRPGEDGAALITALLFLLILTALGLASIMTSSTEVMISRNDRLNKLALDYANAGVQAAMAQMDAKQLGSTAKAASAVGGPWHFSSGSAQLGITFMNFSGTIEYRTENDLHYHGKKTGDGIANHGGSDEVVGYCQCCDYSKSPISDHGRALPVFKITSHGWVGDASNPQALAKVVVEVAKNTIDVTTTNGLESPGCATLNGSIEIYGEGTNPGYSTSASTCDTTGATVSPAAQTNATLDNISTGTFFGFPASEIADYATKTYSYSSNEVLTNIDTIPGKPFGDYSSTPAIVYVDNPGKELTINGGVGYGILVVTGNLKMGGGINWHGLIYCFGDVVLGGGAGQVCNIDGTVKSGGTITNLHGTVKVSQRQSILDKIATQGVKTRLLNWQRIYD